MSRRPGSIFFKLLGIYGLAIVFVGCGVFAIRFLIETSPVVDIPISYVRKGAVLLCREIGNPPDLEKARRMAEENDMAIAIFGPGVEWTSGEPVPEAVRRILEEGAVDRPFAIVEEVNGVALRDGPYRYLFAIPRTDRPLAVIITLILTTIVIVALASTYALVRLLLEPLRAMDRVVREFGLSEWKVRLHPKGNDELASLGRTLDSMADRIEAYVRAMQDLISAISHEVRSPLTRMKVAVASSGDGRLRTVLDREIDTLDRLTGSLLEQKRLATQPGVLKREELSVQAWMDAVCEPFLRDCAPLRVVHEGPEAVAMLDRVRMDMALRNLVENALRHAHGSPIVATLRTGLNSRGAFVLEVRDYGPGVPDEYVERLGDPFLLIDKARSGTRSAGGSGLGLSIVRAVATAHGADFAARNLHPRGFAVTLSFP